MVNEESIKQNTTTSKSTIKISHLFYPVIYVFFSILAEVINFIYMGFGIFPKYVIFDLALILFVAGIIFIVPNKWVKIGIFYLFFGAQIVINCVNVTMNNLFGDILSLDMLKLGAEAASAFSFEFLDFLNIIINVLLVALSVLAVLRLDKKIPTIIEFTRKNKVALLICGFLSIWGCCCGFFFAGKASLREVDASTDLYIVQSDVYLWDNMFLKSEAYKKFGTYGFYFKCLENIAFNEMDDKSKEDLDLFVNQGKDYSVTDAYSSIDKDNNLIMIMLESFEWFAIDPIYTPTLYKLRTETGVSFENFHGRNKTNVSEDISILGSMPKKSMMIEYCDSVGVTTPYSLPNLYKEANANSTSNFFHGYLKTFYSRNVVNKALGFDEVIGLEDVDVPHSSKVFGEWVKDSDFINANMDKFIPNTGEKFFSFYTTIGTHGSYDEEDIAYKEYYQYFDEHLDEFKEYFATTDYVYPTNETEFTHLKVYKSAAMDTDRMVKNILDRLEETNQIDNTTIVMFADHNCYYHDTTNHIKGIDKTEYSNIKLYNIPFMIYSKNLTPEQNYNYCNTYDIYPTICDLLGLKTNGSFVQGYSVFSEDIKNSVFISFLNGIYSDKFYTTNVVDCIKLKDGLTDADLLEFQLNVINFYLKQEQIEKIYKMNYFSL